MTNTQYATTYENPMHGMPFLYKWTLFLVGSAWFQTYKEAIFCSECCRVCSATQQDSCQTDVQYLEFSFVSTQVNNYGNYSCMTHSDHNKIPEQFPDVSSFTTTSLLLHYCFTTASLLLHYCFTTALVLLHYCFTIASLLLHYCFTTASLLL